MRVFILAGQSNMQGQGVVDLDHPKYYNGGNGILKNVMKQPGWAARYAHLADEGGAWVVRDDVFVRYQTKDELKTGGLSIGSRTWLFQYLGASVFTSGSMVTAAYTATATNMVYHTLYPTPNTSVVIVSAAPWTTGTATVTATGQGGFPTVPPNRS